MPRSIAGDRPTKKPPERSLAESEGWQHIHTQPRTKVVLTKSRKNASQIAVNPAPLRVQADSPMKRAFGRRHRSRLGSPPSQNRNIAGLPRHPEPRSPDLTYSRFVQVRSSCRMVPKTKLADRPPPKPIRPNLPPSRSASGINANANGIDALVVLPNRPPASSTRPRNPRSRHFPTIDALSARLASCIETRSSWSMRQPDLASP